MNPKFFVPGWENLLPEEKEVFTEWFRLMLRTQSASTAIIKICNSYTDKMWQHPLDQDFPKVTLNDIADEEFEIIGSQDNVEEQNDQKTFKISSIDDWKKVACKFYCSLNPEPNFDTCVEQCVRDES